MNDSISKLKIFLEASKDPEYRFLLLEPILSYGIAIGILIFAISFFTKHHRLQIAGLIVAAASAFVFMPYMAARRAALPRIEQIYRLDGSSRGKMFLDNTVEWSAATWQYTGVCILGIATIIVGARRNQLGYGLSLATVLIGLSAVQNSLWLHYQDSVAVYPNLRAHHAPIETTPTESEGQSSKRIPKNATPAETSVTGRSENRQIRQIRPIY